VNYGFQCDFNVNYGSALFQCDLNVNYFGFQGIPLGEPFLKSGRLFEWIPALEAEKMASAHILKTRLEDLVTQDLRSCIGRSENAAGG
jgi:hypothetical protein